MSPRPKIEHLRKPQIIAAAAEVLYERGLFDTRIGDVAERAGTSSPTILYYFESKDRLLEEAVDQTDRDFYARVTEGQARQESAADKLVHLIEETSLGPAGPHRLDAVDGDVGPRPPRRERARDATSGWTAASVS